MARIVKHRRIAPYRIENAEFPLYICACGLSRTMPLCDRSHKFCWHEDPERLYTYDKGLRATELDETTLPAVHDVQEEPG